MESKLITPKYITGTYFGGIVAILNFCDLGVGSMVAKIVTKDLSISESFEELLR